MLKCRAIVIQHKDKYHASIYQVAVRDTGIRQQMGLGGSILVHQVLTVVVAINPITICPLTTLVIFGVERLKPFVSKCSRHDKDSLD